MAFTYISEGWQIGNVPKFLEDMSPDRIKELLRDMEKDRSWLAQYLFCSPSTVNGWLSSGKEIPKERLRQIQSILFLESSHHLAEEMFKQSHEHQNDKIINTPKEGKTYSNPIITPANKETAQLWEQVYGFARFEKKEEDGAYKTIWPDLYYVRNLLDSAAKRTLSESLKKGDSFSLKSSLKANVTYLTEKDITSQKSLYILSETAAFMWRIAACMEGHKDLNDWANKIIDQAVEYILLRRIGIDTSKNGLDIKDPNDPDNLPF